MDYAQALSYLASLQGRGMRLDLAAFREALAEVGNPQESYPCVLIGGTNGKGSVAAMTAAVLTAAGYRVGLYTSPHLRDVRERIRISGVEIAPEELAAFTGELASSGGDGLTYFEFLTALAFLFFARRGVDIAVLEVGMGGRLDATNVVNPPTCAVTDVSWEHRAYLGRTLARIAAEKAGIIKEGAVCLTASRKRAVLGVLEEVCRARGARLRRLGAELRVRRRGDGVFSYQGTRWRLHDLKIPLVGDHQIQNAALAVGVAEALEETGTAVGEGAVREGLAAVRWPGRLEVFPCERIQILLDGAHNPAGMAALRRALEGRFRPRRLITVFGCLGDKDYRRMLMKIAPLTDLLILTRPGSDRALPPGSLAAEGRRWCRDVVVKEEPRAALASALAAAGEGDLVCVTGSLYLVGELRGLLAP